MHETAVLFWDCSVDPILNSDENQVLKGWIRVRNVDVERFACQSCLLLFGFCSKKEKNTILVYKAAILLALAAF